MKEEIKYTEVTPNTVEQNRFISINDFKDCMNRHGKVEFNWNDKEYTITHRKYAISISECYKQETEKIYSTVNELLDHKIDGEPLRNIVTKLEVWDRTV